MRVAMMRLIFPITLTLLIGRVYFFWPHANFFFWIPSSDVKMPYVQLRAKALPSLHSCEAVGGRIEGRQMVRNGVRAPPPPLPGPSPGPPPSRP